MRPVVRLESAVDYITCTTKNPKDTALMVHRVEKMAFREFESGNEAEPWRSSGFSGWKVGQVVYATRGGEGLAQLSGATAGYDWFDVYQLCDRVTRIDVQETYRISRDVTRFVLRNFKRANAYSDKHNLRHQNSVWAGNDGGATVYLGSPKSERRMRIYNKAVESKLDHYDGCVRYELQLRDDSARVMAHRLSDGSSPQATIRGVLHRFARDRGCRLPSVDVRPVSDSWTPPKCKPDTVRSLEWLRVQVRPSVCALVSRGLLVEVLAALGFSNVDTERLVQCLQTSTTEKGTKPCPVSSTRLPSLVTTISSLSKTS